MLSGIFFMSVPVVADPKGIYNKRVTRPGSPFCIIISSGGEIIPRQVLDAVRR